MRNIDSRHLYLAGKQHQISHGDNYNKLYLLTLFCLISINHFLTRGFGGLVFGAGELEFGSVGLGFGGVVGELYVHTHTALLYKLTRKSLTTLLLLLPGQDTIQTLTIQATRDHFYIDLRVKIVESDLSE